MTVSRSCRSRIGSDVGILRLGLAVLAVHMATNGRHGRHRDELAGLDDAGHMARGYVAYPPVTPALARLGRTLSGPPLVGVRLFAVAAQCAAVVLAGVIAHDLGGCGGPDW